MRVTRNHLPSRSWSLAAAAATALAVLVASPLPALGDSAAAAAPAAAPVTAAAAPTAWTSAGDRLPGRPSALRPAAAPAAAAPVKAAAAAAPVKAPAPCSGPGWQQRRGEAALASLRAGAERTGFRVAFKSARKGYLGLAHLDARLVEVFVRPCGTQSDELLRHVLAHELGHAYDETHLSTATRRAWMAARGIPAGTPWYGCNGCTDFATPAGDFAEVYAQWARGSATNRSQLAGDVAPARLAQLAQQFFGA